jgi:hypothetical protein
MRSQVSGLLFRLKSKELAMTKIMQINKLQDEASTIPAREIKGQRVVSYKQIAELHQIDTNNLQRNFNRNKSRFIEGTDYFKIKEQTSVVDNLSTWKYYFTESGYLMLVKSLTDDLSWEVQRMLVNSYFRASILDRVIEFLPIEVRKMIRYRKMGLTQSKHRLF